MSPFYLWQAIFTIQPHKEERFMYPAYPFLALNAALAFHLILAYVGTNKPGTLMGLIPGKFKFIAVAAFMLISINAGVLRSVGMVTAYNAPLKVYDALDTPGVVQEGDFLCLGKEWYRFPSSFFLPQSMRAKFVKSEFSGLLPGEFPEGTGVRALLAGTSALPTGMNDRNEEDLSKYVSHVMKYIRKSNNDSIRNRSIFPSVHFWSTPTFVANHQQTWSQITSTTERNGRY